MKELNENQLLSWHPRRASAALKRRILHFADKDELPTVRWLWSCLAPTMACTLLTLMVLNHEGSRLPSQLPVALMLSNQDNAAFAMGGRPDQAKSPRRRHFWMDKRRCFPV